MNRIIHLVSEVTRLLESIAGGDTRSADQLLPLVYDELRKLAAHRLASEAPGQTLQPTALVHEAYVRLVGNVAPQSWSGRGHFFAVCAEAMRRMSSDNYFSPSATIRNPFFPLRISAVSDN